ncbi:MAG: aspartate carbamoyltransferase catalytic subunit [Bdellovibrionaceae bacterium]|jgi:aspartate carbamoyltransferase catalytic subunit|nr:aspartate carbamoyltransferase catalytic subunit [Pseudobdellovibrionaceae bacterium]
MSKALSQFFCTSQYSTEEIENLFQRTEKFKQQFNQSGLIEATNTRGKIVVLAFFEPSTRTRLSFETAAHRLGMKPIQFSDAGSSSISKGEDFFTSLKNIAQLKPDLIIQRWKTPSDLWERTVELSIPMINAGYSCESHPTQALLDIFTMQENLGPLKGRKFFIYGDIQHSRVAQSNIELLLRMGVEVGFSCPDEFLPKQDLWQRAERFEKLSEGIGWCDIVMGLRVQLERHKNEFQKDEYLAKYQFNKNHLSVLSSNAIIMHPGPFNLGVELTSEVLNDSRVKIYDQVENGVYLRAALMEAVIS